MNNKARRQSRKEKRRRKEGFLDFQKILAGRICWYVASKNITLQEFARLSELEERTIRQIINGTAPLKLDAEVPYKIYQVCGEGPSPSSQFVAFVTKLLDINNSTANKLVRYCMKNPNVVSLYLSCHKDDTMRDSPEILLFKQQIGKVGMEVVDLLLEISPSELKVCNRYFKLIRPEKKGGKDK